MSLKSTLVDVDSKIRASIIVASYKNAEMTKRCIESIFRVEPNRNTYEVIVVDDCSGEPHRSNLEAYCKTRNVRFVYKAVNGGFSSSCNTGMYYAKGGLAILINNDVEMITPFLDQLAVNFKEDPRIAIVGCKLLYPNKTVQHAGIAWIGGTLDFVHQYHNLKRDDFRVNEKKYCISVTGAFFAIDRRKMGRIGVLNDDYFIAFEDTEYALNTWSRGYRILYEPKIEAFHLEGHTRGATKEQKSQKGTWNKEVATREFFIRNAMCYNIEYIRGLVNECNSPDRKKVLVVDNTQSDFLIDSVSEIKNPSHHEELGNVMNTVGKKIVLKRQGAIGDVIMTTPIARHLRVVFPDAKIIVATDVPFVYKNNPNINVVVPHNRVPTNVDVVYDLDLCYERMPKMHAVDAYCMKVFGHTKLNRGIELFPDAGDYEFVNAFMRANQLVPEKTLIVHMGVSWKNRTWPVEKWLQTVGTLSLKWKVVIIGTKSRDFVIGKKAANIIEAHDQFTFLQLKCLMDQAACFVGIDSSLFHVAGATDISIVGVFTATNAAYRAPFRGGVLGKGVKIVEPSVDCKGCLHEEVPPVTFVGCRRNDFICLTQITPTTVIQAVEEVMGAK